MPTPRSVARAAATRRTTRLYSRYDIGVNFPWVRTAVAGSLLMSTLRPGRCQGPGQTDGLLDTYLSDGRLPDLPAVRPELIEESVRELLQQSRPGDYLAIMCYYPQDDAAESLVDDLRSRVMERCRIATTAGYGPRYLHSTGQLHKGGPGSGLYLQLTMGAYRELPIPGQRYGFDVLAAAQAIGDYQALSNLGRRVITIDLGDDVVAGLRRLLNSL